MNKNGPIYVSQIRIERKEGPNRLAWLPAEKDPVPFGVHGPVAEFYGKSPEEIPEPHATTLDYVVAAAGGWLTGTFAGALEARHIPAGGGRLSADVRGDIEVEGKVLVIRRIHVTYHLKAAAEQYETIERVHRVYHHSCPVYRSLYKGIDITSEFVLAKD